jgi:hypothetical protein
LALLVGLEPDGIEEGRTGSRQARHGTPVTRLEVAQTQDLADPQHKGPTAFIGAVDHGHGHRLLWQLQEGAEV